MDYVFPLFSVSKGFCRIIILTDEIRLVLLESDPIFNEFASMQGHIKLLHRGILRLLATLQTPVCDFIALGLRITEEHWNNRPRTTYAAIYEVRRIIVAMEPLIDVRNGRLGVLGYQSLFGVEFGLARIAMRSLRVQDPNEVFDLSLQGHVVRPTPEQINALTVHLATEEDIVQDCPLCFERIVTGQEIRILPCSHRFHKSCIDSWLANHVTCPLDRLMAVPSERVMYLRSRLASIMESRQSSS